MSDAPSNDLATRTHFAVAQAYVTHARQRGFKVVDQDGLVMIKSDVNHRWFNSVFTTSNQLSGTEVLRRARAFFGKSSNYSVFALVPQDNDLRHQAQERGLRLYEREHLITASDYPVPHVPLPWLEIRTDPSDELARDMASILKAVYGQSEADRSAIDEFFVSPGMFAPGVRCCVGYVNGEPVSTTSAWLGPKSALAQWGATIPAWRGRGAMRAVFTQAWTWALDAGADSITGQASDAGLHLYGEMGLRPVGALEGFAHDGVLCRPPLDSGQGLALNGLNG